ncbi:MAG: carboxypeptidase regulatory-like domain-containing protein, partial [Candidatus Ratteibacteria bacterium]
MKKVIYPLILIFASVCFCDTITGIVKTTDNKPVIGAEVRVLKIRQVESTPVKTTTSDRFGKFKIEGLETGYYRIIASKKNFCDASPGTIEVNQPKFGIVNYEIVLKKPGSISGFVYDPNGQPVQSAKVISTRNNRSAITDNKGFYKIDGLEPGNFYIYAEAKGFVRNYRANVIVEENKETAGINFTLSYSGAIKGVVVDAETGEVVENAMVECSGKQYYSTKTDLKGKFFVDNMMPGRYDVGVYRQGYESARARGISVVAKETVDIGEIKIKLRPKYFYLNTNQWLFTPGENVKLYFNAYRIPSITIDIYEIDLLNEINKSKGFSRSTKEILMAADISNKAPVLSKKIGVFYKTPLTELYGRTISAGMLSEGAYVCVITPEGMPPQRQVFFVTDVGFISKTCDNKSVFTVFSISKGMTLADIFVYVFDNWWNLKQEVKTDNNGQFVSD